MFHCCRSTLYRQRLHERYEKGRNEKISNLTTFNKNTPDLALPSRVRNVQKIDAEFHKRKKKYSEVEEQIKSRGKKIGDTILFLLSQEIEKNSSDTFSHLLRVIAGRFYRSVVI
jgi:hypothetical protein